MSQRLIDKYRENVCYVELIELYDLYDEVDSLINDELLNDVERILTEEFDQYSEDVFYYDEDLVLVWLPCKGSAQITPINSLVKSPVYRELGIVYIMLKDNKKKLISAGDNSGTYFLVPEKLINFFDCSVSDKEHLELITQHYVDGNPTKYLLTQDES